MVGGTWAAWAADENKVTDAVEACGEALYGILQVKINGVEPRWGGLRAKGMKSRTLTKREIRHLGCAMLPIVQAIGTEAGYGTMTNAARLAFLRALAGIKTGGGEPF